LPDRICHHNAPPAGRYPCRKLSADYRATHAPDGLAISDRFEPPQRLRPVLGRREFGAIGPGHRRLGRSGRALGIFHRGLVSQAETIFGESESLDEKTPSEAPSRPNSGAYSRRVLVNCGTLWLPLEG
jgi:hypothetical protein